MQIVWPTKRFELATCGLTNRGATLTCIMQDANDSANWNSARHGQKPEKEEKSDY